MKDRFKLLNIVAAFMFCLGLQAQNQMPHLFYRVDVASSNPVVFVGSNIITGLVNKMSNRTIFDDMYSYSFYPGQGGYETKHYPFMKGFTGHDMFNDFNTGVKLGYNSDFIMSNVNWGLYASAHYAINQFEGKRMGETDFFNNDIQRMQLGGGVMLILGNIEKPWRIILEAGLRYNIPVYYHGHALLTKDDLNKGLTGHYAVKFGGQGWMQNIGLYADVMHYDLFKSNAPIQGGNTRIHSVGLTYTLTFAEHD